MRAFVEYENTAETNGLKKLPKQEIRIINGYPSDHRTPAFENVA
jgi:hypothetical protein